MQPQVKWALPLLVGALTIGAPVASAQPATISQLPASLDAFGVVMRSFIERHSLEHATLVVRQRGRVVYEWSHRDDPKQPHLLASLSKAITAACIATLVRDGKLAFTGSVGSILSAGASSDFQTPNPAIAAISLEQLITHRSGLAGNGGDGEVSSGQSLFDAMNQHGLGPQTTRALVPVVLKKPPKHSPGSYHYSNDNYLLLGAVIEKITGKSYEQACRERVLTPAGVTGQLSPVWAAMGPYGGWEMRGADYLKVLEAINRDNHLVGSPGLSWRDQGRVTSTAGYWYGLGSFVRPTNNGVNIWHWGSWRFPAPPRYPQATASYNTFALYNSGRDLSVFVSFEPQLPEGTRLMLDPEIWRAINTLPR